MIGGAGVLSANCLRFAFKFQNCNSIPICKTAANVSGPRQRLVCSTNTIEQRKWSVLASYSTNRCGAVIAFDDDEFCLNCELLQNLSFVPASYSPQSIPVFLLSPGKASQFPPIFGIGSDTMSLLICSMTGARRWKPS